MTAGYQFIATEESKDYEVMLDGAMPSMVIMEDHFEIDAKDK